MNFFKVFIFKFDIQETILHIRINFYKKYDSTKNNITIIKMLL